MAPSKNQIKIRVNLNPETQTCVINKDATGASLLSFICKRLGTYEPWWFGLQYVDSRNIKSWIALEKKVGSHDIASKDKDWHLINFKVKHYPENIGAEVIQTKTIDLFYKHIREEVINEVIYSDPGVIVMLAGLHLQHLYGDLVGTDKGKQLFKSNISKLIPSGLKARHNMSIEEWEDLIMEFWASSRFLSRYEALKEAMNSIQNLDMYGVDYYNIKNKRKTPLLLGITSQGMNIYKTDNRLVPKVCLTWNEIKSIAYNDKKFTIKPLDKNASEFIMYSDYNKENIIIMDLCIERHEMFLARRRPDTSDVVAWKDKARKEEKIVEDEIINFKKSIQEKANYQKTLNKVQQAKIDNSDTAELQKRLKDDYNTALKDMASKVDAVEAEKDKFLQERQKAEKELENILLNMESKNKEAENERRHREEMEEEHTKMLLAAQKKEEEAERLRLELEAFKSKFEEDQKIIKKLESDLASGKVVQLEDNIDDSKQRTASMKIKADGFTLRMREKRTQTIEEDNNHEEIVQSGAEKFKTLKLLRSGNVRTRIDEFESL